jgi:hypothetical protein
MAMHVIKLIDDLAAALVLGKSQDEGQYGYQVTGRMALTRPFFGIG